MPFLFDFVYFKKTCFGNFKVSLTLKTKCQFQDNLQNLKALCDLLLGITQTGLEWKLIENKLLVCCSTNATEPLTVELNLFRGFFWRKIRFHQYFFSFFLHRAFQMLKHKLRISIIHFLQFVLIKSKLNINRVVFFSISFSGFKTLKWKKTEGLFNLFSFQGG